GTTAGPESPPLSSAARESRRRPPFCLRGPWQSKQLSASSGRTDFSKNSAWAGEGFRSAARAARGKSRQAPRRTGRRADIRSTPRSAGGRGGRRGAAGGNPPGEGVFLYHAPRRAAGVSSSVGVWAGGGGAAPVWLRTNGGGPPAAGRRSAARRQAPQGLLRLTREPGARLTGGQRL